MKQLLAGIILLLLIGGITMIAEYEPTLVPKPAEHQAVDSIALSYCLSPGRRKALELQDGWAGYGSLSPGHYCIVVYYYGWDEQGTHHALYTFGISE